MAAKVAAAIITFLISIAVAAVTLFVMLVAMNGYSESDAAWGLGAFILLSVLIAVGSGAVAFLFTGRLMKRAHPPFVAAVIAVLACAPAPIVLEIGASLIGVGISELVRKNF
jgi:hypothetical protein